MAKKLRFEALYPFRPEQVWVVLIDPVALSEWLMPNDFAPLLGHRFQFRTKPAPGFSGVVECEVLTLDAPRRLAFTWVGGGIDTVVTFDLHAEGDNTRLVMEQTGFKGMRGLMVSNILKGGWKRMIGQRLPAAAGRVAGGVTTPSLVRRTPTAILTRTTDATPSCRPVPCARPHFDALGAEGPGAHPPGRGHGAG